MRSSMLLTFLSGLALERNDVLQLDQGQIIGSSLRTRNGREFKAYQGIPYAQPPIGNLRFKESVPAKPWSGVLQATTEPQSCIQKDLFFYQSANILTGSEDCLYLNVYTPKLTRYEENNDKLLPVMFFVPGGGFIAGGGGINTYNPSYLLDKDVVVVTINYRLGLLGFLSTGDGVIPANNGMKDQVLALKWVKTNIKKFGGDHNRVTLFGQSAGSASVGLHLLSPMSKGLFHKAILQSGTPLNQFAVSPSGLAKQTALAVANITACPTESKQLLKCLQGKSASDLVNVNDNYFDYKRTFELFPIAENCYGKGEAFLCDYPLLRYKQESNVSVMMGMTTAEGGLLAARFYNATNLIEKDLRDHFDDVIASLFQYKFTAKSSDIPLIGRQVFERYYPDGDLDDPLKSVKMVTGGEFVHGILKMAKMLTSPVHFYVYDHLNYKSFNSFYGPYPFPRKLGVTHGDDLTSIFNITTMNHLIGEDFDVSKLMVDLWTNFATTDNITINGMSDGQKWPTFDFKNLEYLLINSSRPTLAKDPGYKEYTFWEGLPLLSGLKER